MENKNSDLSKYLEENININPFTGVNYSPTQNETAEELYKNDLKSELY